MCAEESVQVCAEESVFYEGARGVGGFVSNGRLSRLIEVSQTLDGSLPITLDLHVPISKLF